MTAGNVFFAVCALTCLVGALATVLSRNPIRSAVGLLVTILGIAGLFLMLHAQFLAAIQLIVYAGAVVVLFVFVIMLLGSDAGASTVEPSRARFSRIIGSLTMVALAGSALALIGTGATEPTFFPPASPGHGTIEAVGGLMFTRGIIPFELATALLIVAVVGAIAVARSRPAPAKPASKGGETRRLFAGPLHPRDAGQPLPKESVR